MSQSIWIGLLGTAAGVMIGSVGVGGVVLVPALVYVVGLPIQICIPAVMMAYILSGLVATIVFARKGTINWELSAWLCAGATPTAFAGAWLANVVNARVLEVGLGLLAAFAGACSIMVRENAIPVMRNLPRPTLFAVGAGTGFLSSTSGTSGPLVLVPILISFHMPVLLAVGLSQAIQLPIAVAATVGNALYGHIDLALTGILSVTLTLGASFGAKLAHVVPRSMLRRILSALLIVVGAAILARVAAGMLQ